MILFEIAEAFIVADVFIYSQTCIKRPPKGRPKCGFLRQMVS